MTPQAEDIARRSFGLGVRECFVRGSSKGDEEGLSFPFTSLIRNS